MVQQQGEDLRIISYVSRSLSDKKRRFSKTEKEVLAIVWACERFYAHLYGAEFELMTDHKPWIFQVLKTLQIPHHACCIQRQIQKMSM